MSELRHLIIPILMGMASYGMWITMYPGQALHWLRNLLALAMAPLPDWMHKPFYTCQRCMVSFWGLSFCWVLGLLVHQEQAVIRFAKMDFMWWAHDLRALAMLPIYCVLAVCVHGKLIGE